MATSVNLRFIFANHDGKSVEESFATSATVREVKKQVMSHRWPIASVPVESISHLRFFAQGRELEDSKTLSECRIPTDQSFAIPIHVQTVAKKMSQPKVPESSKAQESRRSNKCFCLII
eukprot:GILK01008170.1.p1 GENE.GILK01008170.1~~GILK01008170.1.p1  ORF type:complete len:140 (-),score=8.38 GILK01008170.1:188-544(-)